MKQIFRCLMILTVLISFCGCNSTDPVIDSLPAYTQLTVYSEGGFQDFTDFAIYTYDDIDTTLLDNNIYFSPIAKDDIENILSYVDNFEDWIEVYRNGTEPSQLVENYIFDRTIIGENDYICIETKEGTPIGDSVYGKFDNYTVYFFDTDTNTLFYFHSNI